MEYTRTIQTLDVRCTTTEEKSPITRCVETTEHTIVTLHMRCNVNFNINLTPYFSIDNAHLIYNAHPKHFRHSFWCIDNAHDAI
jgi:hypothetical protein